MTQTNDMRTVLAAALAASACWRSPCGGSAEVAATATSAHHGSSRRPDHGTGRPTTAPAPAATDTTARSGQGAGHRRPASTARPSRSATSRR